MSLLRLLPNSVFGLGGNKRKRENNSHGRHRHVYVIFHLSLCCQFYLTLCIQREILFLFDTSKFVPVHWFIHVVITSKYLYCAFVAFAELNIFR